MVCTIQVGLYGTICAPPVKGPYGTICAIQVGPYRIIVLQNARQESPLISHPNEPFGKNFGQDAFGKGLCDATLYFHPSSPISCFCFCFCTYLIRRISRYRKISLSIFVTKSPISTQINPSEAKLNQVKPSETK